MTRLNHKIVLFSLGSMVAFLVACGSDQPVPVATQTTVEQPVAVESVSENSELTAEGYPGPDGYPGPETQGTNPETLKRPEQWNQFPGSIAFSSDRISLSDVFILNGETGLLEKFPVNVAAYEPDWSPDCQKIGVTGATATNVFRLFIGDASGQNGSADIGTDNSENAFDYGLDWSPNGQIVAFHRLTPPKINICFADAATGEVLSCLPNVGYSNAMPAWSPDGTKFVFSSDRSGNYELYSANYPDDGNYTQLTNNPDLDYDPEYSPDGSKIVFSSRRTSHFDIYTINPDGSGEAQITSIGSDEKAPTWVGNSQIALVSDQTTNDEIFLVDAFGGPVTQLTKDHQLTFNLAMDSDPTWCGSN